MRKDFSHLQPAHAMQAYMSVVQPERCEEDKKERSSKKQKSSKEEMDPVLQYPMNIVCMGAQSNISYTSNPSTKIIIA